MPADPFSIALGGLQAIGGGIQAISGRRQAKRAQEGYQNLATPTTQNNAAISDYYTRATANPYDTSFYKNAQQNINRGTAQGIGALQDRRAGISGIAGLLRQQNDSYLRAGAQAEGMQRSMLGHAVGLKARDDERVWGINKMMPYEKQAGIFLSKAAAGNQIMNSGLQNIFNGLGTAAMGASGGGGIGSLFGGGGNRGEGGASARYNQPTSVVDNSQMRYQSPASIFG